VTAVAPAAPSAAIKAISTVRLQLLMWLLISPPFRFRAFRSPLRVDAQHSAAVVAHVDGDSDRRRRPLDCSGWHVRPAVDAHNGTSAVAARRPDRSLAGRQAGRRAVRFDYAGDGNYQRHQRRDANAPRCLHASFVVAGLRLTQRSKHPWELVPSGITLRSAQIEGKP
jgi:hypothetical protein